MSPLPGPVVPEQAAGAAGGPCSERPVPCSRCLTHALSK